MLYIVEKGTCKELKSFVTVDAESEKNAEAMAQKFLREKNLHLDSIKTNSIGCKFWIVTRWIQL